MGMPSMNTKEINVGVVLLIVMVVLWDLSRDGSILRAIAKQIGSIGLNDIAAGFFGA